MNPTDIEDDRPRYRENSTAEALERVKERQRHNLRQENHPMNVERDCDWENTRFEDHEND